MRMTVAVLAMTAAWSAGAQAADLKPLTAESIDLGTVRGVAYYTVEPNGYRVVATVSGEDATQPVRMVALLSPGQSVSLSVPGRESRPETTISFTRRGDEIRVEPSSVAN
jgi:hypothetical protein